MFHFFDSILKRSITNTYSLILNIYRLSRRIDSGTIEIALDTNRIE